MAADRLRLVVLLLFAALAFVQSRLPRIDPPIQGGPEQRINAAGDMSIHGPPRLGGPEQVDLNWANWEQGRRFCTDYGSQLIYWKANDVCKAPGNYPEGTLSCQNGLWDGNSNWNAPCPMLANYLSMEYGTPVLVNYSTPEVFVQEYPNQGSVQQDVEVDFDQSTSASYTTTNTLTVQMGYELSFTAGLPEVLQETAKFSLNIDVTQETSKTTTETQGWSIKQTTHVPPYSKMCAYMIVMKAIYDVPYDALLQFNGTATTFCSPKVQGASLYFWNGAFIGNPGVYPQCAGDTCKVTGTLRAVQGMKAEAGWHQIKLNEVCPPQPPGALLPFL